ncbi:MAG: hypothetical protein SF182_23280 [Deltaproteobacteria bacterium]|nr:hypothetical protein [Deltaproteobacteria bacterium]
MPYASSEHLSHAIEDLEREVACLHSEQAHPTLIDALQHHIGALRLRLDVLTC